MNIPKSVEIITGTLSEIKEEPDFFAYRDGKAYKTYATKGLFCYGCCLGRFLFVFNEDGEVISTAPPMFNFNNGFEKISVGSVAYHEKIAKAYQEFNQ